MANHFMSLRVLWIATLFSTIYTQDVIFPYNGGNRGPCTTRKGGRGRCVDIGSCPKMQKNFLTSPPVYCGFNSFLPIVCCPTTTAPDRMRCPKLTLKNGRVQVRSRGRMARFKCRRRFTLTGGDRHVTCVRGQWIGKIPRCIKPVTDDPGNVLDISSPDFRPDFECGRSAAKTVNVFHRYKRASSYFGIPSFPTEHTVVVGGHTSTRNAWPWMALIGNRKADGKNDWFCAGALINDQWIVTAAHCFDTKRPQIVRLGEHDYDDNYDGANHQDFGINKIIPHPNYRYPVAYHDLALIQLSSKVRLQEFIAPACLPWGEESKRILTNTKVKLAGWGDTKDYGEPSSVLQEVDLTLFSNSKCLENYSKLRSFNLNWPNRIGEETTCAGDPNGGRDACQGDSGGPITYRTQDGRYTIKGIVSRGYGCGLKDYPGIYTNVQYPSYLAWIKKVAF